MATDFKYEHGMPQARSAGDFLYRVTFALGGQTGEGNVGLETKNASIEASLKEQVGDLELKLGGDLTPDNTRALATAIATGSKRGFGEALRDALGLEVVSKALNTDTLILEPGLEASVTPFAFTGGVKWSEADLGVSASVKLCLGLSAQGWLKLVHRVGLPRVWHFVSEVMPRAVGQCIRGLIASGALVWTVAVAGGVAGTFGLVAVLAWSKRAGAESLERKALSMWYAQAYTRRLFDDPNPVRDEYAGENAREMVRLAREDVETDALRESIKHHGDVCLPLEEALRQYRRDVIAAYGGTRERAQPRLELAIREQVEALLNNPSSADAVRVFSRPGLTT